MKITLLSILILTGACSTQSKYVKITKPDGTKTEIVDLGNSAGENTASETAEYINPDGTIMRYTKVGKDQSTVVDQYIKGKTTRELTKGLIKGVDNTGLDLSE